MASPVTVTLITYSMKRLRPVSERTLTVSMRPREGSHGHRAEWEGSHGQRAV